MDRKVLSTSILEATRADIRLSNGHFITMTSSFDDSQGGVGYDGGHWGTYPYFRDAVEGEVKNAQNVWGLPDAEIKYTRITQTTRTVEETTLTKKHYATRTVQKDG